MEDGDEIPLTGKKELKESFWNSKKFSVDSIQGLDDLKTKSFDETWITGQLKFVPCKTHCQNTLALNLCQKVFCLCTTIFLINGLNISTKHVKAYILLFSKVQILIFIVTKKWKDIIFDPPEEKILVKVIKFKIIDYLLKGHLI